MGTKMIPRTRPTNLPTASDFPDDPVVKLPTESEDQPTFDWCEDLRDHYEKEGQLLTVDGLLKIAETTGLSDTDVKGLKKQIRRFYTDEHSSGQGSKSDSKPSKEKKVSATATATAPKKKTAKPTKAAAKPSKNGKKAAAKPSTNGHTEGKTILDKTVRGLSVLVVKTDSGKFRVKIDDIPLRGLFRWMGSAGWNTGEALNAAGVLLKDMKGGEGYAKELLDEGHLGCGAKGKKGVASSFGNIPTPSKDAVKSLNALKK